MNTKNRISIATLGMIFGIVIIIFINKKINPITNTTINIEREQQHITAMAEGADPKLGMTTIPADGFVGSEFVSHLPLVIIDLNGNDIPLAKETTAEQEVIYKDVDPYVQGDISIINSPDHVNHPEDAAELKSKIKIKYRGNFSLNLDKKQFGIKLIDDSMNNQKLSVLGMEPNNDWILNISQLDESLIRNYLAYNVGSSLFEGTPECRYCEVLFREGDKFKYQGLYLMLEKVEKGEGRVELNGYDPGEKIVDYLLCRDREDERETQISTYGNEAGLTNGRLSVLYPDAKDIDEYAFNYIQNDIDRIDRILYSEDDSVFSSWPEYIDMNSFADYFIFNELMSNYDAGDNSTYMYKKGVGKLCMGPLWDYDGAMDNALEISNPEYLAFYECPWFEKLVTSQKFMTYSYNRYNELVSKGNILSDEFLTSYIDDVSAFIGNAALRDRSRWSESYDNNIVHDAPDCDGNVIPRDNTDWQSEVMRLKSYFVVKEEYMGTALKEMLYEIDDREQVGTYFAIVMITFFVCAVILIRRKGFYR